jgi:ferredoxin-fold anticodon binding domain-containing protein
MLSKQVVKAEKSVGKEIILEDIYSKQIKKEILEKFKDRKLFLKNGEVLELDKWNIL